MQTKITNMKLAIRNEKIINAPFKGVNGRSYPLGTLLSYDNTLKAYKPRSEHTEATDNEATAVLNETLHVDKDTAIRVDVIIEGEVSQQFVTFANGDLDPLHVFTNAKNNVFEELKSHGILLINDKSWN